MIKQPYSATFRDDAPAGYGGTHWFHTLNERFAFLKRFEERNPDAGLVTWLVRTETHPEGRTAGKYGLTIEPKA
jgi:hypothetical protein